MPQLDESETPARSSSASHGMHSINKVQRLWPVTTITDHCMFRLRYYCR